MKDLGLCCGKRDKKESTMKKYTKKIKKYGLN